MTDHIHIITHEIPWPVDYGGVYDLFYKIKALHERGIKIHLHCFSRHRKPQAMLDQYCHEVHYYQRKTSFLKIISGIPFIVADRSDNKLAERLNQDTHPILAEGVHVTYCLRKINKTNRKIIVRLHNIESIYYKELCKNEDNILKKIYFKTESFLLSQYEKKIINDFHTLAVSQKDLGNILNKYPHAKIDYLPVFIPWKQSKSLEGLGSYCLYHGNLSINENEKAVIWLLKKVFKNSSIPLVIAGKNPSDDLIDLAHRKQNTCIVANPDSHEMEDMIRKAQINILPSFNNTGVKIKAIESLFLGRHCISNSNGSGDTNLDPLLEKANSTEEIITLIEKLYNRPFTNSEFENRHIALNKIFDEQQSIKKLINWLH